MRGIVRITCPKKHNHGTVKIREVTGGLEFRFDVQGLGEGKHGCHIHKSGNLKDAPTHLCSHYNPDGYVHGDLNEPRVHRGDLGNIRFDASGHCRKKLVATRLTLPEIYGRSLIIHEGEDDLGEGGNEKSEKDGNSGAKRLFGVIAVDEPCEE